MSHTVGLALHKFTRVREERDCENMSSYTEELKEAPVGMTKTKSRLVRGHRFVLFFSMRIVDSPPHLPPVFWNLPQEE